MEKSDHDLLVEVHTMLLGTNGQGGLARQVEANTKAITKLWIAEAVIVASTGGGAYAIVQKLIGG